MKSRSIIACYYSWLDTCITEGYSENGILHITSETAYRLKPIEDVAVQLRSRRMQTESRVWINLHESLGLALGKHEPVNFGSTNDAELAMLDDMYNSLSAQGRIVATCQPVQNKSRVYAIKILLKAFIKHLSKLYAVDTPKSSLPIQEPWLIGEVERNYHRTLPDAPRTKPPIF